MYSNKCECKLKIGNTRSKCVMYSYSQISDASSKFGQDGGFQVPVNVRLWRAPGVHEFLASLGLLFSFNIINKIFL